MRVLHVIASLAPESGGTAKACFEMARAVARRGHRVSIFTTDDGYPTGRQSERWERDGVDIRLFKRQSPYFFGTSWPLADALEAEIGGYDAVHLHSFYLFHDWATAQACRRNGVPYVLQPHGSLDPYQFRQHRLRKFVIERLFQNAVTRGARYLHYTAEEEMRLSTPYALGVPGVVIPLGLDLSDYQPIALRGTFRRRHPEIGARPIVLFLGRLHAKKGLDVLARAFAESLRRGLDAHLVIAGPDDGMKASVQRILESEGVASHATFTGMVEGAEKLALLADADVFALPSWSENFGIAVVEALATGVPVLVSNHVNIWREIIASGCGLVTPIDEAQVSEAIVRMLGDRKTLDAMRARGKALVAERFAWPRVAEALEALYAEITTEQKRAVEA